MTQVLDSKTNQVVRSDWGLTRGGLQKEDLLRIPEDTTAGGNKGHTVLGLRSAERAPQAADLGGLSQAVSWRGEARTGRAGRKK